LPIIGKVGRRSLKMRILNVVIHLVLLIGAITMIYPFTMMVSASFKSHVDSINFSVYPEFFVNDEVLYRKYIEARYNEESNQMIENYKGRFISFEHLEIPEKPIERVFTDWQEFLDIYRDSHDIFDYYISEQFGRGIYPRNERIFRKIIKKESDGDLKNFNDKYGTSILSWEEVRVEERDILSCNFTGDYKDFLQRYEKFRGELQLWNRVYCTLDGNFIKNELMTAYRSRLDMLNSELGTDYRNWEEITLSSSLPDNAFKEHWTKFVKEQINIHHIGVNEGAETGYQDFLNNKYGNIELLNKTYRSHYLDFDEIDIPEELPRSGAKLVDWIFFVENEVAPEQLTLRSVELDFRQWLQNKYNSIDQLNRAYEKGYNELEELPLSDKYPVGNLALQKDWGSFVKNRADRRAVGLLMTSQVEYLEFLKSKFPDYTSGIDLESYNRIAGTSYKKSMNIYPPEKLPETEEFQELWLEFVTTHVSEKFLKIGADQERENWVSFLQEKYGSADVLNLEYHLLYDDFNEVEIDNYTIDYYSYREHQTDIFWEFVKRNYVMVLDLMLYNGNAIVNTLIYCLLAIVTALIINPLAAYAMSRFRLRSTYKILLVLMLTMAFPPMVMGIPSFLLLKKFNLLNTFWALILPAAADGYFIFLLKGFFDSLPKELFESATMDGAGEGRIFWQIAMSLSKPIMAVIALGAFNAAYRNFMFAFIVCQDKSMWTMMVHIYQLIQRSAPGVGFAALVIAAIPTFAVFVFFQNIIIRGIVVPTEK